MGWPEYLRKALGRQAHWHTAICSIIKDRFNIASEAFGLVEISKCLLLMMDWFSGRLDMFSFPTFCDVGLQMSTFPFQYLQEITMIPWPARS